MLTTSPPAAFLDAAVFGDSNLELPSAMSNRSIVEIHMDIRNNLLENYETVIQLPLHARYPVSLRKKQNGYDTLLWSVSCYLRLCLYSFGGCMLKLAFYIIKICNFNW